MYPETIPEDLQTSINDWFDLREVCDDDNFTIFFKRTLNMCYNQYMELLRIQPGYAKYDWLVNQYHEIEHKATGNETTLGTTKDSNNKTVTGTNKGSSKTTYNGSRINSKEGTETTNEDTGKTTETTGTNTDVTEYQDKADSKSTQTAYGKSLTKSAPMSISNGAEVGGDGLPTLNWEYASGQQGNSDTTITAPALHNTNTVNGSNESKTTDKGDRTSVLSFGSRKDIESYEGRNDAREDSGETKTTESGSGTAETTGVTDRTALDREQMTGRSGGTAELLAQASDYIKSTNAFVWLVGKLEPCFMGVYDI